ncbi:MAG TPA: HlyD family secretion protein [Gemmatimonadales bacterium]|nr:HlyD family secretion protein [Gemmatimonadales bacterium]
MSTTVRPIRPPAESEPAPPPAAESSPTARVPGRRRLVWALLVAGVLATLVWGFRAWQYGRTHESTDNAQVDGHIVPVLAKVGGYVGAVRVGENQHVRENEVLVQLDSLELRQRLAQAEAEVAAAAAAAGVAGNAGQAEAAVREAMSQEAATEAQIAAARAAEANAIADRRRYEKLAEVGGVSQQQLDAARAAAEAAVADRESLERRAVAGSASVTGARAGVRLAEARLQAALAARDAAALQLSYTTIRAPAAGVVARRQVEAGQLAQPGQPLLSVVADTGVYVTANLKETQLDRVRVGQPVELDVDAYGGCTARGTVESISGATGAKFSLIPPENATGNFTKVVQRVPVRIAVTEGCGAGRPLRPGISVEAHIETAGP